MPKSKALVFFVLSLVLAAGAGAYLFYSRPVETLESIFKTEGFSSPLNQFKIQSERRLTIHSQEVREFKAELGGVTADIRMISLKDSDPANYVKQRLLSINSEFNRGVSPYPGQVSDKSACPEEFKPRLDEASGSTWIATFIQTYGNRRKQLGVCSSSEKVFSAFIALLYCEHKNKIFDIAIWDGPEVSDWRTKMESVTCD